MKLLLLEMPLRPSSNRVLPDLYFGRQVYSFRPEFLMVWPNRTRLLHMLLRLLRYAYFRRSYFNQFVSLSTALAFSSRLNMGFA